MYQKWLEDITSAHNVINLYKKMENSAEKYITEWCDKTYGGGKELGDWTTEEVIKFANDYAQEKSKTSFLIIECGCEGIEGLLYSTSDEKEASEKIQLLKSKIIKAKEHRDNVLKEFGTDEDEEFQDAWDRMMMDKTIDYEEFSNAKYKDENSYCAQKWDGEKFSCVCQELGCAPNQTWYM